MKQKISFLIDHKNNWIENKIKKFIKNYQTSKYLLKIIYDLKKENI